MATVSELEVVLRGDDGDLDSALERGDRGVENFTSRTGRRMGKWARDIAAFAAGVGIAIGVASVGMAIDWETSFTNVEKTVDGTDAQLAALEDTLRNLATEGVTSSLNDAHTALAEIAAAAGSLGIATDDIDEFTETVAIMSVATGMGAEEVATWAARFANVTGMDMGNLPLLSDTLVTLENKMAATSEEITAFSGRMANLANFGFNEAEILGYAAAMASLGLNAELGSTNFVKSVSDMTGAVAEGGGELQTYADVAGMTADEFTELAKTDGEGAFLAFLNGLRELPVEEQLRRLNDLGITSQEQQRTIMTLASGYNTVTQSLGLANEAWEGNGAALKEATSMSDTTQGSINRLGNVLKDTGIELGSNFTPAIGTLADGLSDLLSGNREAGLQGLARGLGELGTGLVGVIDDIGTMVTGNELFSFQTTIDQWTFAWNALRTITQDMLQDAKLFFLNLQYEVVAGALNMMQATNFNGVFDGAIADARMTIGIIVDEEQAINAARALEDIMQTQAPINLADMVTFDSAGESVTMSMEDILLNPEITAEIDPFALDELRTQITDEIFNLYGNGMQDSEEFEVAMQIAVNLGVDTTAIQAQVGQDIEAALTSAYAAGDEAAIEALLPLAVDLGIDTAAVQAQARSEMITAIGGQTYPAIAYVDLVIIPSSVDDSAVRAAADRSATVGTGASGGGSGGGNTTVVNSYGQNPYELGELVNGSNQAMGGP